MRVLPALALLAVLLAPAHVRADTGGRMTAGELARMCSSASNLDYGYCAGYVTGVADAMMTGGVAGYRACNHGAVRSQQYVDLFKAYMDKFPEAAGRNADEAVAAAFARAFPCSSNP